MFEVLHKNNLIIQNEPFIAKNPEIRMPVLHEHYKFNEQLANGCFKRFAWNDISIHYGKTTLSENISYDFERIENEPKVKMIFCLQGNISLRFKEPDRKIKLECNRHNLVFLPGCCKGNVATQLCTQCTACSNWSFFEINFSPVFLNRYMPKSDKVLNSFQELIQQRVPGTCCDEAMNISLKMHEIINDIIQCQYNGKLKHLCLEVKILDLLFLQLEQVLKKESPVAEGCRRTEIEKIYKAREILMEDICNPCPLMQLALKVGTNECTLKKVFKEVFGNTVYGYILETRMQRAKKLLLDDTCTVSEIAEKVGYKNATHFTSAFKKRFGVLPSKMKLVTSEN